MVPLMAGSIRKRGKSWYVVVDLGRDEGGRRRQLSRTVHGNKRAADDVLEELLNERRRGQGQPDEKLTVAAYLERWLDSYGKTHLAPKTLKGYRDIVRLHLKPAIGNALLTKLRPAQIESCYAQALGKGLSARSVLHVHRMLREALQHAYRQELISRNPADLVEAPRPARYEAATVTLEMVGEIVAAAQETRYGTAVYLAVMTGLRQGELLGLRWQDVDLDGRQIHVRQALQVVPGGITFRPPKTATSKRAVEIGDATVAVLRQHRKAQLEERLFMGGAYENQDLVFATAYGKPVNPSSLREAWVKVLKVTGYKLRFHDLRHAHASLLLAQGTHPKIVQERLGHSGIAITMDTYSHSLPSLQRDAIELLEKRLRANP